MGTFIGVFLAFIVFCGVFIGWEALDRLETALKIDSDLLVILCLVPLFGYLLHLIWITYKYRKPLIKLLGKI
jgi:divalent metal cation (Fe/Co/Zn/Cd) transporter